MLEYDHISLIMNMYFSKYKYSYFLLPGIYQTLSIWYLWPRKGSYNCTQKKIGDVKHLQNRGMKDSPLGTLNL